MSICAGGRALSACQQTALHYGKLVALPTARATPKPTPTQTEDAHGRFEPRPTHRCHARTEDGFDLDARVAIAQGDDRGRERLVRYCARPAIVLERLEKLSDGYSYRTKYTRNGRTHRVMTGTELMARIAALVPPPRYPLVRYHGCFAPAHTWRRLVVPRPPEPRAKAARRPTTVDTEGAEAEPAAALGALPGPGGDDSFEPAPLRSPFILSDYHMRRLLDGLLLMTGSRADWATLLRRSHDIDVLDCPRCHGRLRLLAVVRDKHQARRFLRYLGEPDDPQPLASARDPTFDFCA